jgi:hypothetical protein
MKHTVIRIIILSCLAGMAFLAALHFCHWVCGRIGVYSDRDRIYQLEYQCDSLQREIDAIAE